MGRLVPVLMLGACCALMAPALGAAEAATAAAVAAPDPFLELLAGAPATLAAQRRWMAAQRTLGAAGRLADPMVTLKGVRTTYSPVEDFDRRLRFKEVMLEQPLPRWGERDGRTLRAGAELAMAEAEWRQSIAENAAETTLLLIEAETAEARTAVLERQRARAQALRAAVQARLAGGQGALDEGLGLDNRLQALELAVADARRARLDALSEARACCGVGPEMVMPASSLPAPEAVRPETAPGMLVARARRLEAQAMGVAARAMRLPETSVGVGFEKNGDEEMVNAQLRVTLPVWQGAAADEEAAALARQVAADRDRDAVQRRIDAALSRVGRAAAFAAQAEAAARATAARQQRELDAWIQAAGVGRQGLGALLDAFDRLGESELAAVEARAAARRVQAELWRYAPPQLPEPTP